MEARPASGARADAETEPEMHVAATFDDVSELLDVFQAHGIDKAEICLVGWNKSGHDGRWPQPFPVEERLGGEEALKRLTAKARAMGYAMVCHTNSTDGLFHRRLLGRDRHPLR